MALTDRFDPKDYVDLYLLLAEKSLDIFELMDIGKKKDAGLDPFIWASLIADVAKLSVMPRMIRPLPKSTLDDFFLKLRDKILDHLKPNER